MISKKMQDAFNDQIAAEFHSAYIYLAMSAYLESIDLPGCATWMRLQYQEELAHGEKFFDYLHERDGRAEVRAIDTPPLEWSSVLDVFEKAYAHEQKVTGLIDKLVDLAREEKDRASEIFLQWFVTEQVEEEASVNAIIQKLKMVGDSKGGLFMVDRELGQRSPAPEPAAE
jgi:ferritin